MEHREKEEKDARVVDGYFFAGEDDAALAQQEKKKIEYLERHMDYKVPANVLMVYKKAIEERIFKTPVGYEYLRKMQAALLEAGVFEPGEIPPVRLYVNFDPKIRNAGRMVPNRIRPAARKEKFRALPFSILLNVALFVAVCAMFVIALKSDTPNMLNYEAAVTNRYAAWEQELQEREQAVREKEREWKLEQAGN